MLSRCATTCLLWIVLLASIVSMVVGQLSRDPDELLNWCIDSKYHKSKPGPEDQLHNQCTAWKERSCCTLNTTTSLHNSGHYNMDWNHCSIQKKEPMSLDCRRHFVQDLCFYECEPNLGPWTVKVEETTKRRKERFVNVPICASDCEDWFRDCLEDYTCVDNWSKKFVWKYGKNNCPEGAQCMRFGDMFRDAKDFCETIFDESWKYTRDDESCMRLFFNATSGNPNELVAKEKVAKLVAAWNGCPIPAAASAIVLYSMCLIAIMN